MGSETRSEPAKPSISHLKLWLAALAGLVVPSLAVHFWPVQSWATSAEAAHRQSLAEESWQAPWVSIQKDGFGPAWIRCSTLEDALQLDEKIDDGHLHTGRLILAEGGLAWLP